MVYMEELLGKNANLLHAYGINTNFQTKVYWVFRNKTKINSFVISIILFGELQ